MKIKLSIISSALVGIVFGVLANYSILLGSWLNLGVWAIVGILIGFFIEDKKYVNRSGITYGVFLAATFLISGFKGSSDKIFGFTLLTFVLCVIGAFCGWVLVSGANWIKRKIF